MDQQQLASAHAAQTRAHLSARGAARLVLATLALTSCTRGEKTPTDPVALSTARGSNTSLAYVDSTLALKGGSERVQLKELGNLIVTDGAVPTTAETVRAALDAALPTLQGGTAGVKLLISLQNARVFEVLGAEEQKDAPLASKLDSATGPDFAVPAYVNVAAPSDTLYLLNSLIVEFYRDPSPDELEAFQNIYGISILQRPARDSGFVNYLFRYPAKTRAPLRIIDSVAKHPNVRLSAPNIWNTGLRLLSVPNDPLYAFQHNLNSATLRLGIPVDVRAELAWTQGLGSGVKIAVIDDGIWAAHPDLVGRVSTSWLNTTGDGVNATSPSWTGGHGTAVAGIIAANRNNSLGISGLAPSATLYAIRSLNNAGGATSAWLIAGVDQARTVFNVDVINGSWGSSTYDSGVAAAIGRARTLGRGGKGIAMAFASGNDISASNVYHPSRETGVISVGAIGPTGTRANYSTGGPRLDVVAPTTQSTVFTGDYFAEYCGTSDGTPTLLVQGATCFASDLGPGYSRFTGTSSAAPSVAAIAALVIERFPTISGDAVRDRIRAQADYWGPQNDFGMGKANAYLSLVGRVTASISAPSLVPEGVVTKTCSAANGLGSYSFRWYLSYTGSTADLFDTGVTSNSFSQSIYAGDSYLFRCTVTDGVQAIAVDRTVNAY